MGDYNKSIESYYNKCQKYYNWLWLDKESLGMHYGFWEKDTKSKKEALINQYREIEKILKPRKEELILDAGCGVGGASFWLALKTGAKFVGITLSSVQIKIIEKFKKTKFFDVKDRVEFYKMDFFNTSFDNNTFDKMFMIESFCYTYPNPDNFLKEAYRILKKEGKIMISDGFLKRRPNNHKESKILKSFYSGWKLKGGNTKEEIFKSFKIVGFKNIKFIDKSEQTKRNVNIMYGIAIILYPLFKFLKFVKIISKIEVENFNACLDQKFIFDNKIGGYGIFYAEK